MRYAVYVEGLSEMLFVADVLQKYSNYDPAQCGFLCVNLNADNYDRLSSPRQGDVNSANYYQIVKKLTIPKLVFIILKMIGKQVK